MAATAWGCEHQSSARIAKVCLMESNHTAFSCKDSGLVVKLTHVLLVPILMELFTVNAVDMVL